METSIFTSAKSYQFLFDASIHETLKKALADYEKRREEYSREHAPLIQQAIDLNFPTVQARIVSDYATTEAPKDVDVVVWHAE